MRVKTAVEAPRSDFQNEVIPMPTPPHQIALKRATEREARMSAVLASGAATMDYRSPFPWFGGKSRAAPLVWSALGDVLNYVEPFFGAGAVYFLRPHPHQIATLNDKDGMVANFWRALRANPAAVAEWADQPVFENDLHARHYQDYRECGYFRRFEPAEYAEAAWGLSA